MNVSCIPPMGAGWVKQIGEGMYEYGKDGRASTCSGEDLLCGMADKLVVQLHPCNLTVGAVREPLGVFIPAPFSLEKKLFEHTQAVPTEKREG